MIAQRIMEKKGFQISYKNETLKQEDLKQVVSDLSKWMKSVKMENAVVAVLETSNFHSFLLTLALNACGCVIMYTDIKSGKKGIEDILGAYQPDFVVFNAQICAKYGVHIDDVKGDSFDLYKNQYQVHETGHHNSLCKQILEKYPDAFVFFTSGTSSISKAVLRDETCVIEDAYNNIKTFSITEKDKLLCPVPFGHAYGFGSGVIPFALAGASVHFSDAVLTGKQLGTLIGEKGINYLIGNPIHYQILYASWAKELNVRVALSAGSPLAAEFNAKFREKFGSVVNNMYGCSETGAITTLVECDNPECLKSCGPALQGVEVKCDAIQGSDNIETIYVKSKALATGYLDYQNGTINKITGTDGYYATTDLGYLDEEGNVYISCRSNDVINVAGKKISPQLIEEVIRSYDESYEAVVAGENDSQYNQYPVVYFTDKNVDIAGLRTCLSQALPPTFIPKKFYYIPEYPKTNTGKIARSRLNKDKSDLHIELIEEKQGE